MGLVIGEGEMGNQAESSLVPYQPSLRPEGEFNLLIISDLHLGEDLNPSGHSPYLSYIDRLERALCEFLAYYTVEKTDGKPWRLIVNGDMVDFLGIHLPPQTALAQDQPLSEDEERFGLGPTR